MLGPMRLSHVALVLCLLTLPAWSEEVGSVPRPAPSTWATDTTHTLSAGALEQIARLGREVNDQHWGQLGVAVVSTTSGRDSREYATELFNTWGIGHAGADDGVLLFVALKDHKAEIILGKGLTGSEDRARSDALMSGEIVPAFKRGAPEQAILAGARGLRSLLQAHAAPPASTPPPASSTSTASTASQAFEPPSEPPPERSQWGTLGYVGGGAGAALLAGLGVYSWRRRVALACETCGKPRTALGPLERSEQLSEGERFEEHVGSARYLVTRCVPCEGPVIKERRARSSAYHPCALCHFVAARETLQVTRQASYTHEGEKRRTLACSHCNHQAVSLLSIPMLVESSSSSDSSSSSSSDSWSSSSDSSSSSSSSDYSGGSSSGDGSSGSW